MGIERFDIKKHNINIRYGTAIRFAAAAAAFAVLYLAVRYVLPVFWPFVLAVLIALVDEPVVDLLERRLKVKRSVGALVSLLFTAAAAGALVVFCALRLYSELLVLKDNATFYLKNASSQLNTFIAQANLDFDGMPFNLSSLAQESLKTLVPKLEKIILFMTDYILNTLSSLPKITLFIFVTILSAYYISSDRRQIRNFIYKQLPASWSKNFPGVKGDAFKAVYAYIRTHLVLMLLSFLEICAGLFLVKADYILTLALLVGLSEAVPILGTGIVMIPWIIWHLILGNISMVLYLIILYLAGIIIKLIVKPFLTREELTLHPLVSLVSMYLGLYLFGVLGMILTPLFLLVLKALRRSNSFALWK